MAVSAWCALDDEDLWSEDPEFMKGHFVKTSSDIGLTGSLAEDAVFILRATTTPTSTEGNASDMTDRASSMV
jgi:hypothetical protein